MQIPVNEFERSFSIRIAKRWRRPWLNRLMIALSDPYEWVLYLSAFVIVLFYLDWTAALNALLLTGVAATLTDAINTRLIKPNTDRIRPHRSLSEVSVLGSMHHGSKSFPSNHASNTMAVSLAIGIYFPGSMPLMLPFVLLVGFSRIYCGAHYLLDVAVGWLHAAFWTILLYQILKLMI